MQVITGLELPLAATGSLLHRKLRLDLEPLRETRTRQVYPVAPRGLGKGVDGSGMFHGRENK